MAGKNKHAARSQRSHRDDTYLRRLAWNAHRRAEEKMKMEVGRMIAEQLNKDNDKKENN